MSDLAKQALDSRDVLGSSGTLEIVLQSLPMGVVIFDRGLGVLMANQYASNLMDVQQSADCMLAKGTNEKIWGNWRQVLSDVIEYGKACRFENVEYRFGDKRFLLQITISPIRSSSSSPSQAGIIILEDITERANVQKQLANVERLAALGKLASKVAHELNNPLDGIMRYINLARRAISQQGLTKPVEYLEHAGEGLRRMVHIITELLEFSRSRYSTLEEVSIDKLIDDAIRFIEPTASAANVRIERQYKSPLPTTREGNLFQVFTNLLKNAVEAMPDGGTVIISCDVADVAEDSSQFLVIKFQDTGSGFDPANSDKIFEPFFTTKSGSRGTGLGLAISKDIVEKCGGKIVAQNAPQGGSIFSVYLPLNSNIQTTREGLNG